MLVGVWVAQEGSANFDPGSTVEFTADGKYATEEKSGGTYGTTSFTATSSSWSKWPTAGSSRPTSLTITRLTPEGLETIEDSTNKKDVFLKR